MGCGPMAANERISLLLAEYSKRYGTPAIKLDSNSCAALPGTGRVNISISPVSARQGYGVLYSRDLCPMSRDLTDRVLGLRALLGQTVGSACGMIYTLGGGMPYGCLLVHIQSLTVEHLEEAKLSMTTELESWKDSMQEYAPAKRLRPQLAASTILFINDCLASLCEPHTHLDPFTQCIHLATSDLEFQIGPSARGTDYARVSATVCPTLADAEEWPFWFLLRRNEIGDLAFGMHDDSVVALRDVKAHELDPGQFPMLIHRFLEACREIRTVLQQRRFSFGACLSLGQSVASPQYHMQYWYECCDCRIETSIGLCLPCAHHCHRGHAVKMQMPSGFFCDCPATGTCSFQQSALAAGDTLCCTALLDMLELSDVTFVLDDGAALHGHRAILSRSPEFCRRILDAIQCSGGEWDPPTHEPRVVASLEVPLTGVSLSTGRAMLRWLYGDPHALQALEAPEAQRIVAFVAGGGVLDPIPVWLGGLVDSPQFADIVLQSGGSRFHAHRAVLCTRSDYFHRLLTNGMLESGAPEVDIGDGQAPMSVVRALLVYLYTDVVDAGDLGHALSLFCLAKELVLEALAYRCEVLLCHLVDEASVAELYPLCVQYDSHTVASVCVDLLSRQQDRDPSAPHRDVVYTAWCQSCASMLLKGDFHAVVALASRASALCPDSSQALALQAAAHVCLDEFALAERCLAAAKECACGGSRDVHLYSSIFAFITKSLDVAIWELALAVLHDDGDDGRSQSQQCCSAEQLGSSPGWGGTALAATDSNPGSSAPPAMDSDPRGNISPPTQILPGSAASHSNPGGAAFGPWTHRDTCSTVSVPSHSNCTAAGSGSLLQDAAEDPTPSVTPCVLDAQQCSAQQELPAQTVDCSICPNVAAVPHFIPQDKSSSAADNHGSLLGPDQPAIRDPCSQHNERVNQPCTLDCSPDRSAGESTLAGIGLDPPSGSDHPAQSDGLPGPQPNPHPLSDLVGTAETSNMWGDALPCPTSVEFDALPGPTAVQAGTPTSPSLCQADATMPSGTDTGSGPDSGLTCVYTPEVCKRSRAISVLKKAKDPTVKLLAAVYCGDADVIGLSVCNCPLLTMCQGLALERAGLPSKAQLIYGRASAMVNPLPFPWARNAYLHVSKG